MTQNSKSLLIDLDSEMRTGRKQNLPEELRRERLNEGRSFMKWTEQDKEKMRRALEDCYMLARRKRAITHRYPEGKPPEQIGPKSDDADWDHIIRFCEQAGLQSSILRTMEKKDHATV